MMIVKLPSERLRTTPQFLKEWGELSAETKDSLMDLVRRFLLGERLPRSKFKAFWIDGSHKILEFKVRDLTGNWRAIAVFDSGLLVLVCAFHKKSQELREKDKETIRSRIRGLR